MRSVRAFLLATFFCTTCTLLTHQIYAQKTESSPTKSLPDLIEEVEPAVAVIQTDNAIGSGFLVSTDGIVITNHHVIEEASNAKVRFSDGEEFDVEGILKMDEARDIAILKIKPRQSNVLKLAAALPRKGDPVYTFGAPLGEFDFSVSEGIVSAIRAKDELPLPELEGTWIQTTAPISHGNNGGPLVNTKGEVVGMNTLGFEGQNLNFAISCVDIADLFKASKLIRKPKPFPGANTKESQVADSTKDLPITDDMLIEFFTASARAADQAIAECEANLARARTLWKAAFNAEFHPSMRYKKGQSFAILETQEGTKIYCKDEEGRSQAVDLFSELVNLLGEQLAQLKDPATGKITAALYYGPKADLSRLNHVGRIDKVTIERVTGAGEFLAAGEAKVKLYVRGVDTSTLLTGQSIEGGVFAYMGVASYTPRGGYERRIAVVRYLSVDYLSQEYSRLYPDRKAPPKRKPKAAPQPKPSTKLGPSRQWKDKEGKLSITAKFIRLEAANVFLQPDSGLTIKFPLEKLSLEDQQWVRDFNK